jgi:hypothetical protein
MHRSTSKWVDAGKYFGPSGDMAKSCSNMNRDKKLAVIPKFLMDIIVLKYMIICLIEEYWLEHRKESTIDNHTYLPCKLAVRFLKSWKSSPEERQTLTTVQPHSNAS